MQILAEYYLIYSQIVFSHLHFCFFRLLPVSLSFRLPCSCLSILIFVHCAYLRSFRLSSFISPELYSGIGSSEPPYIDQTWSISRLLPFFFPFARMPFGYTATAAKRHFFSPYCKKNRNSLANVRFFSYLCTAIGQMAVSVLLYDVKSGR